MIASMWLKYFPLVSFKAIGLFFLLFISSNLLAQQDTICQFKTITIRKDTVPLVEDDSKIQLIALSNNNACRDCFRMLNNTSEELHEMIDSGEVKVKFLCRVEQSSFSRREQIKSLCSEVPKLAKPANIFFDVYQDEYQYNKQGTSGVFGYFKVNRSPALLVYFPNNGFHVIKYELFYKFLKEVDEISIDNIRKLIKL